MFFHGFSMFFNEFLKRFKGVRCVLTAFLCLASDAAPRGGACHRHRLAGALQDSAAACRASVAKSLPRLPRSAPGAEGDGKALRAQLAALVAQEEASLGRVLSLRRSTFLYTCLYTFWYKGISLCIVSSL